MIRRLALALALLLGTGPAWGGGPVTPPTPIATTSVTGKVKPDGSSITVTGDGTISAPSGTSFANPTGSVGPTAANGTASTAMRSDAAPAVNLTSTYNWTGPHTFSPGANLIQLATTGSHTGSDATSDFSLATTLNTSGSPDVFKIAVTDTARGASTKLVNIYAGAAGTTSEWSLDRSGNTTQTGQMLAGTVTGGSSGAVAMGISVSRGLYSPGGGTVSISGSGTPYAFGATTGLVAPSSVPIGFSASADPGTSAGDTALSRAAAGDIVVGTGAAASAAGSIRGQIKPVAKTGNYTVLTTDTETHFDNTGASGEVDFTLPAAASGLQYCFAVTAAQILKVIANTGDKIAIATSNSAATGNISNNAVYGSVCIEAHGTGQWFATSHEGTWTVT